MKKQARIYETKRADKVEIEIERGFADVRIERSVKERRGMKQEEKEGKMTSWKDELWKVDIKIHALSWKI